MIAVRDAAEMFFSKSKKKKKNDLLLSNGNYLVTNDILR